MASASWKAIAIRRRHVSKVFDECSFSCRLPFDACSRINAPSAFTHEIPKIIAEYSDDVGVVETKQDVQLLLEG